MKEVYLTAHKAKKWTWGKLFRDIRLFRGETQEEIGKRIGKDRSTISKWELGESEMSMRDVERICSKIHGIRVENFTENTPIDWANLW